MEGNMKCVRKREKGEISRDRVIEKENRENERERIKNKIMRVEKEKFSVNEKVFLVQMGE